MVLATPHLHKYERMWFFTIRGHSLPIHISIKEVGGLGCEKLELQKKASLLLGYARAFQIAVRIRVRVSRFGLCSCHLTCPQRSKETPGWKVSLQQAVAMWPISCIVMLFSFARSLTFLICHSNYQGQRKVIWSLNYLLCIRLSCRLSRKGVRPSTSFEGQGGHRGISANPTERSLNNALSHFFCALKAVL